MTATVRDYMRTEVRTVAPTDSLAELDRMLTGSGYSGAPVVEGERLLGVVSRADVVRRMAVEQSKAEQILDFYRPPGWPQDDSDALDEIGAVSGQQLQHLRVRDIMSEQLIVVEPGASMQQAAACMHEHRIHRLPVADGGKLLGILTAQDVVRYVAEQG